MRKMPCRRGRAATVEALEPRRLLSSSPPQPGLLVNAGGPAAHDAISRSFAADGGYFSGGRPDVAPAGDVRGTLDDALHRQHRAGRTIHFAAPLADGDYVVTLKFVEPSLPAGGRVFDVIAEGRTVIDDFDVAAAAGGAMTAVAAAANVTVRDGTLDLTLHSPAGGEAIVSAVVVAPLDATAEAAASFAAVQPGPAGDAALEVHGASHLRTILQAAMFHSYDGPAGAFPPDLMTLVRGGLLDADTLANPRTTSRVPRALLDDAERVAWAATLDDYVYVGAGLRSRDATADVPIVYDRPARVAGRIGVGFADGHVELLDRADAAALLGFDDVPPADAPPPRPALPRPDADLLDVGRDLLEIARRVSLASLENRGGRLPETLGEIVYRDDATPDLFLSPRSDTAAPSDWAAMSDAERSAWVDANADYAYLGRGLTDRRLTPRRVVAFETPEKVVRGPRDVLPVALGYGNVGVYETPWSDQLIDASRPLAVDASAYAFDAPRPELRLSLNRYAASFLTGDFGSLSEPTASRLTLTNVTNGAAIDPATLEARYEDLTQTLTIRRVGGAAFADGDYRLALAPSALTDNGREFSRTPQAADFFVLAGDADRDRAVTIADFAVLRQSFGGSGLFGDGDFNYDGQVTLADFAVLRSNFGKALPVPAAASLFADAGEEERRREKWL